MSAGGDQAISILDGHFDDAVLSDRGTDAMDFAYLVALQLDQADVAIRTLGQPAKCWTTRWSAKAPAPGLDRTDAVDLDMAYRGSDPPGTVSSNPSRSSGESVSAVNSGAVGEKPGAFAPVCTANGTRKGDELATHPLIWPFRILRRVRVT